MMFDGMLEFKARGSSPMRFPGTPFQLAQNRATHYFMTNGDPDDGDYRCGDCDCRPGLAYATWRCRDNFDLPIPRVTFGSFTPTKEYA